MTATLVRTYCLKCDRVSEHCTCNIMDDQAEQYAGRKMDIDTDSYSERPQERVPETQPARSEYWARVAARWKELYVRELMRRGAAPEEIYTAIEMDHARQEAMLWNVEDDGKGNLLAERQS